MEKTKAMPKNFKLNLLLLSLTLIVPLLLPTSSMAKDAVRMYDPCKQSISGSEQSNVTIAVYNDTKKQSGSKTDVTIYYKCQPLENGSAPSEHSLGTMEPGETYILNSAEKIAYVKTRPSKRNSSTLFRTIYTNQEAESRDDKTCYLKPGKVHHGGRHGHKYTSHTATCDDWK